MDYFKYFPTIDYMFGDHAQKDKFRNISIYTDDKFIKLPLYNNTVIL